MEFGFRPGARIAGVTAEQAGVALSEIRERHDGILTRQNVVDAAQDEEHDLHPAFNWDDASAANFHRCHTAGKLIKAIVIVQDNQTTEPQFVHVVTQEHGSFYQLAREVIAVPEELQSAMSELLGNITNCIHTCQDFAGMVNGGRGDGAHLSAIGDHLERALRAAERFRDE